MRHYLEEELYRELASDSRILEFLQDGSLDGVWYWDLENPDHEWLSPKLKAIFGYSDDEIENSPDWWKVNVHPDDYDIAFRNFKAHKRDPSHPYDHIVRYRHKDGSWVWVHCRAIILRDEGGEPKRMLGVHIDVTDLKRKERALNKAHRDAEEAIRVRDQFLANLSHEIRTPLTGIQGSLDMIKRETNSQSIMSHIAVAEQSYRTLLDTIERLIDLSSVQSRKSKVHSDCFSLPQLMDKVSTRYAPIAKAKNLEIANNLAGDVPSDVISDPSILEKILSNLVDNAVKFTKQGRVEINAEMDWEDPSGAPSLTLDIADTGVGISAKDLGRIFQRFEQGDGSLTRRHSGLGVGLSIVKELVSQLDGTIMVNSSVDVGTTVRVTIPITLPEADNAQGGGAESQPLDLTNSRVLIVEDNPINQYTMNSFMEIMGVGTVLTAANGQEAIDILEHEEVDLIFMDLQMPVMDGLQASRQIRDTMPDLASVPIIAVTAHVYEEDIQRCTEAGMDEHISKPFQFEEIYAVIQQFA